jgi:hypothetical protein
MGGRTFAPLPTTLTRLLPKQNGSVTLRAFTIPKKGGDRSQLRPMPSMPHHQRMAFVVRLSELEFLDATQVAIERMRSSAKRNLCHATIRRQRSLTTRLHDDVLGACAELAVAKWLGVQWSRSVDTFHSEADVGEDVDVRCTTNDNGSLIMRDNDQPWRWMVLVSGTPPVLSLRGYVRGSDAMTPQYWCNPHGYRGAWFVPQSDLLPITADGIVPPCLRQGHRADNRSNCCR